MNDSQLKERLFAIPGQYSEDQELVKAIRALDLPELSSGLTGGSHGTSQPYTDHKWGNNIIRICKWGIDEEKPSVHVIDCTYADYVEGLKLYESD